MEAIIDNEVLCDVITEIKIFVEIHFEIDYKYHNLNIVKHNWNAKITLIWIWNFRWHVILLNILVTMIVLLL